MKVINLFPNAPAVINRCVRYTCPHCETKNEFYFNNATYKIVIFNCGTCDHEVKLANPDLVNKKPH